MKKRKLSKRQLKKIVELDPTDKRDENTGIIFSIEEREPLPKITFEDLVKKFYTINRGQKPLAFSLVTDLSHSLPEKAWWVIWRGSFFMDISKGSELVGPHRCRLWFKTFTVKENIWLASAQVVGFFFNEVEMRQGVRTVFDNKEFFILPHNQQIEIQL